MSSSIHRFSVILLCWLCLSLPVHSEVIRSHSGENERSLARSGLDGVQLPFVANQGQMDASVLFYARTFHGHSAVMRDGRLMHRLVRPESSGDGLSMITLGERIIGARMDGAMIRATDPASMIVNEYRGVQAYRQLPVSDGLDLGTILPGIQLTLRTTPAAIEKLFTIGPEASIEDLRIELEGTSGLEVDADGQLIAHTHHGPVAFTRPIAWQDTAEGRRMIEVAYSTSGTHHYGFELGEHDPTLAVVIDPLISSTYYGGSSNDTVTDMAYREGDDVLLVIGHTPSLDLPGAGTSNGSFDVFVLGLKDQLAAPVFATYIGGSADDRAWGMRLDENDNAYITGETSSSDYPNSVGYGNPAQISMFVTHVEGETGGLIESIIIGGSNNDVGRDVTFLSGSGVYLVGDTASNDMPTNGGSFDPTHNGSVDVFVARFDIDLTLLATSYIGGDNVDSGLAIDISPVTGEVAIAGFNNNGGYPTGGGVLQPAYGGGTSDAIISVFEEGLSNLLASTYQGGAGNEQYNDLLIDPISNDVLLIGTSSSSGLPTSSGAFQASHASNDDALLTSVKIDLSGLVAQSYAGGEGNDQGTRLVLTDADRIFATGTTASSNFKTTAGAYDTALAGASDAFMLSLDTNFRLATAVSSYLGGTAAEQGTAVTWSKNMDLPYFGGVTSSGDFPLEGTPIQTGNNGGADGYLALMSRSLASTDVEFVQNNTNEPENAVTTTVAVRRLGDLAGAVSVDCVTSNGTALAGSDYTATSQTLNWASGDGTNKFCTIPINDDGIDEANEFFNLALSNPVNAGLGARDTSRVFIIDNDGPTVTLGVSGTTLAENGGSRSVTATLSTTSPQTVTVNLGFTGAAVAGTDYSSTAGVITIFSGSTSGNVVLTGLDDDVDEGNESIVIDIVSVTNGMEQGTQQALITIIDDDSAGVTVTPQTGLTTDENGLTDSYTVVLDSEPTASVSINVVTTDASEVTASPSTLNFTTLNWNEQQIVTLTGQADASIDPDQVITIDNQAAISSDPNYNGFDPANVAVTNLNTDSNTLSVFKDADGNEPSIPGRFEIRLDSPTLVDTAVDIDYSISGSAAPGSDYQFLSGTVTLAANSQNLFLPVNVFDDAIVEGTEQVTLMLDATNHPNVFINSLNGMADVDILDNDTPFVMVTPAGGLTTDEGGGTDSFDVVLGSEPTSSVTISLSSSDAGEGTVFPNSLVFNAGNWNLPQTATVQGVDDPIDDGNVVYTIITTANSTDPFYDGISVADVGVTNLNDDLADLIVLLQSVDPDTEESGDTAVYSIELAAQPINPVTVTISSSDPSEGTVSTSSLSFNSTSWNNPQNLTITGVDDDVDDGDQAYLIDLGISSSDPAYGPLDPVDIPVLNLDDDTVGITLTPSGGLLTNEDGGTDSFTIELNSEPIDMVTIGISSSASGEGVPDVSSVVFDAATWDIPQLITVTGVDDAIIDGTQFYDIVIEPAISPGDALYNGQDAPDVSASNDDNDVAGILVSPTSLSTDESGTTDSFTVVLESQPGAPVSITLFVGDPTEGSVSQPTIDFTPGDWNIPQVITVIGIDDTVIDNDQVYTISLDPAASSDPNYNGFDAADVLVTNADLDSTTVSISAGADAQEPSVPSQFIITLDGGITADVGVMVNLMVSGTAGNGSDYSAIGTSGVIPAGNSSATIDILPIDDLIAEGSESVTLTLTGTNRAQVTVNGALSSDSLNLLDDDTAGVAITPGPFNTTEAGGTDTLDIRLLSEPVNNVTITVLSSDVGEVSVSPGSLVFTPANWNVTQQVLLTGIDDQVADGPQSILLNFSSSSADPVYNGLGIPSEIVNNSDDDAVGVSVAPTAGLVTTEAGGSDSFDVVLDSQPTADVMISLVSSDPSEGSPSPAALTFTALNWFSAQTVTVTGLDDDVSDGDQPYQIVTSVASSDPSYNGLLAADPQLSNQDDDVAGVQVSPLSGLVTTEAGGSDSFDVVLQSEPTDTVSIPVASSLPGEGVASPATLVFTTGNWNVPQGVTVTGVDDDIVDGNQAYMVQLSSASSSDPSYNGLDPADVSVVNNDDDIASVQVNPVAGLTTTEAGGTAQFTVVLGAEPVSLLTIDLASDNPAEGLADTGQLMFDNVNWNTPQIVTITGQDDLVADGDVAYTIVLDPVSGADPNFAGIDPADVSVTNNDNEVPGVTVNPTSGLVTSESGGTASFSIVLNTQPTADVVISSLSDTPSEGVAAPASVTFTSSNWDTAQLVTVTGVDDAVADGAQGYQINNSLSSSDPVYAAIDPADVSVSNDDNDAVGILVSPTAGLTTDEGGTTDQFSIVLASQPTADVLLSLSSSDASEGTAAPGSLTFTMANWNLPQVITVTGQSDGLIDGDQPYTVITSTSTSADPLYDGIDPDDVSVLNVDGDTTTVSITTASQAAEPASDGQFTVSLDGGITSTSDLLISYAVSGSASPGSDYVSLSGSVTIPSGLSSAVIDVSVLDDVVSEGDETVISTLTASSNPSVSLNGGASIASVTIVDDDAAAILVTPTSGLLTSESGDSDTFSVVLATQPTASVDVSLSSSDATEGTASPASLSFSTINWNVPQIVTVTGVDDAEDDGDVAYSIVTSASSGDAVYDAIDPDDVLLSNSDDDVAAVIIAPLSGLITTESGASDSFSVVLGSRPTADVVINLNSDTPTEGQPASASLTFTAADWNLSQLVSVTGVDDDIVDGDQAYQVVTSISSADPVYAIIDPDDVSLTNQDNDSASVIISPTGGLITNESGGTASYTIVLGSEPIADVFIGTLSDTPSEGTSSPSSLTFTSGNWDTAQTVTVTGVDDAVTDGNQVYQINHSLSSTDPVYAAIVPVDVMLTNVDNDAVGILVSPTAGLVTDETGSSDQFSVVLASQPTADVQISLSSTDPSEGIAAPGSLIFSTTDWNVPQLVTITGQPDAQIDGDQGYSIVTSASSSADPQYDGLDPADVAVINTDGDVTTVRIDSISNAAEPATAGQFLVALEGGITSTTDVVLTYSVSGTASAGSDYTALSGTLTLPAGASSAPIDVVVTDDAIAEGDETVIVTLVGVSSPAVTINSSAADASVTLVDDETAGVSVTPVSGLVTSESGGSDTFSVVLTTQPTASVGIALQSSNMAEGVVSPASLSFTTTNWDTPQLVTVTGVDDVVDDGDVIFSILTTASSGDPVYDAIDPADVSVSNADDDTAGITISPVSALTTSESGGSDSFTVVLETRPTADVVISLVSDTLTEGIATPASLTFGAADWNQVRTVTVTGQDDDVDDDDQAYQIVTSLSSSDAVYQAIEPVDVSVTNVDNDTAQVVVTPTSGLMTSESGDSDNYVVALGTQPTADVTISVVSDTPSEATASPASLTFTSVNWQVPQIVTVTGVDDTVTDGDQAYQILNTLSSTDASYAAIDPADVAASNSDNDSAMFTLTGTADLFVTEDGQGANFSVALSSQPTDTVSMTLDVSDSTQGRVIPPVVSFTPGNWNTPRVINVLSEDDALIDGDVQFLVITGDAQSNDLNFDGVVVPDVPVINRDNDVAGVTVSPITGLITSEQGSSSGFRVSLNAQPVEDVTIDLISSDPSEGILLTSQLVYTTANWSVAQFVQINGVDDDDPDGNQSYQIDTRPSISLDLNFDGLDPANVSVINTDDETSTIIISPVEGLKTSESGGTADFSVVLSNPPTSDVVIDLASSDTTEGTISISSLMFTAGNWQTPQTVTVSGVDDDLVDGDQVYLIITSAAVSTDPVYSGMNAEDVQLTNTDDDVDVADLRITKSNGQSSIVPGQMVTYLIRVSNVGSLAIDDARVIDVVPAELIGAQWTCTAQGGASCTDSGEGDVDELLGLPVGSAVDILLTATVDSDAVMVSNTATVSVPSGFVDVNPEDNSATDLDMVSDEIFADDFESNLKRLDQKGLFTITDSLLADLDGIPVSVPVDTQWGVVEGIQLRRTMQGQVEFRYYLHADPTDIELSPWMPLDDQARLLDASGK